MGWQWHQLDHMQIICTSLQTDNHASTSPLSFCRPDALPATQPTASKHWRHVWCTVVWRIRGKIIRTVLCCVVYESRAQWYAHAYEQFLKLSVGLGLVLVHLFRFSILCFFFSFSFRLFCWCVVCCCCVRFSFFTSKPRDWLGRTSPKWPIFMSSGT